MFYMRLEVDTRRAVRWVKVLKWLVRFRLLTLAEAIQIAEATVTDLLELKEPRIA